jgi:hypothetical protein
MLMLNTIPAVRSWGYGELLLTTALYSTFLLTLIIENIIQ